MTDKANRPTESDERFPSGWWKGFFLQKPAIRLRRWMDLTLTFREGLIKGEGSDYVGPFLIRGRYEVDGGRVLIWKRYIRKHDIVYEGWAEIQHGIWGMWDYAKIDKGGFHLWPKAMGDPTRLREAAEVEQPVAVEEGATA